MIGTSDGEQFEDEWDHIMSQIQGKDPQKPVIEPPKEDPGKLITDWPDIGMFKGKMTELYTLSPNQLREYHQELGERVKQKVAPGIDPNLSDEDIEATILAQNYPNFSKEYKLNQKAWDEWINKGPWSSNIEDRRDTDIKDMVDIKDILTDMKKNQPQRISMFKDSKPFMEAGGGMGIPRISSNTNKPHDPSQGKDPFQIPTRPTQEVELNKSWNDFIKQNKLEAFKDKFKIVPKE